MKTSISSALKTTLKVTACAALLASASSAFAQSSVQLYGQVDEWVGAQKFPGGKTAVQVSGGGMSTSYWGLKGAEDLGNGYKAIFTLEGFFRAQNGQFGQDVPAVNANDAAMAGDTVVLQGPSDATDNRYNFGIYALASATVRWDLIRTDGTRAASAEKTYPAGTQFQYNNGIVTLLGGTAADDDTIQAFVENGSVIAYGSAINNASGDPTFVAGIRGRADTLVNFIGVDIAGDGTIDVTDANHDGILDQPIDLYMTAFPTYFRVVATGPNDAPLTLSFINPPDDARFVDTKGDVQWYPSPSEGPMTTLKVLATWSGGSEVLTIPVHLH